MRRTAITLFILFLACGLAYAKDYEVTKKAGEFTVQIRMDKNPPATGQNKMDIGIKDATGKDIADAVVTVEYVMPAMPGMPAMNYKAKTELNGNRYIATVNFSMPGAWGVTVKITRAGKTQPVKFNVDVS